jgi:hypothetical protein
MVRGGVARFDFIQEQSACKRKNAMLAVQFRVFFGCKLLKAARPIKSPEIAQNAECGMQNVEAPRRTERHGGRSLLRSLPVLAEAAEAGGGPPAD